MESIKIKYGSVIIYSLFTSLSALIIFYLIAYWLFGDGFNDVRLALFSLLPGVVYFFVILILNSYFNFLYLKGCEINAIEPLKWYSNFAVFALSIFLISSILDFSYFLIIDNSISREFAEGLKSFISDPAKEQELDAFAKLPPFLQGYVVNLIAIIFGSLFSYLIGKSVYSSNILRTVH